MPYTFARICIAFRVEVEKYLPNNRRRRSPLGKWKNFAWDEVNQKWFPVDLIDEKTVFPMWNFLQCQVGQEVLGIS